MYRIEHGAVADIAFVKLRPRVNLTAMTRLLVVNDDDLFNELMNGMRADVAGTAANQNCHDIFPFFNYQTLSLSRRR